MGHFMAQSKTMADETPKPVSLKLRLIRTAAAPLFAAILLIPKIRRLRRNVRLWNLLRIAMAAGAAILLWRAAADRLALLILPALALLSGALIRARPERKSIDALAAEVGALIVANGGRMIDAIHLHPRPQVNLFACPERLVVFTESGSRIEEIPFSEINAVARHPAEDGPQAPRRRFARQAAFPAWDLEITWQAGELRTRFRYEGAFAEHLAGVAETTLLQFWKPRLPVIPS